MSICIQRYVCIYICIYMYTYMDMYVYIYIHTYMCVYMYMHYIHLCSFLDIHIYIHIMSLLPSCPTKKNMDHWHMSHDHVSCRHVCESQDTQGPNPNRFFPGHEVWPLEWSMGRCHPRCYWNHSYIPKLWFRGAFAHSADLRPKLEKTDMGENRGLSTYSRTDLHIPTCHKSLYSNLELPTCSCCSI